MCKQIITIDPFDSWLLYHILLFKSKQYMTYEYTGIYLKKIIKKNKKSNKQGLFMPYGKHFLRHLLYSNEVGFFLCLNMCSFE